MDEVRGLIDKYRALAASVPATKFCELVLADGTPRLYTALLLRDLYGLNLAECKALIGTALQNERKPDSN